MSEKMSSEEVLKKKVQELKSKRKVLESKREEIAEEIAETEDRLSQIGKVTSSQKLKKLPHSSTALKKLEEKLSENNGAEVIVEERNIGGPLSHADVFLRTDNGAETVASLNRDQSPKSDFLINFIEGEFEPAGVHRHESGIEHRVWRIGGDDVKVFGELISSDLSHEQVECWEEFGLQGVKKMLEHVKKMAKSPLSTRHQNSRLKQIPRRVRTNYRNVARKLKGKVFEYAQENDLTIKEAMVALQMKDDEFSDSYENLKNKLRETVERWESAFEPYLRLRSEIGEE